MKFSEACKSAVADWRETSQMDKVEVVVLVMAVATFLVLVLALIALEI